MIKNYLNSSIKNKIMMVVLVTSALVLFLASIGFFANESISFWQLEREKLLILSDIVGKNSSAAITFNDKKSAAETLEGLSLNPHILSAYIITKDDKIFAKYIARGLDKNNIVSKPKHYIELMRETNSSSLWNFDYDIDVAKPIFLDNQLIATIFIKSNTDELFSKLFQLISIFIIIMFGTLCVAYLVSAKLQRLITSPILNLVQAMEAVSEKKNYSIRVKNKSNDEIGTLNKGFNNMLAQIEERDRELKNKGIKLQEFNEKLKKEVVERKLIEEKQTELIKEIESVNQELKDFAYIVSHDLKAPLRAIGSLSDWLATDYQDKFDEDGREQLNLLKGRVKRMHDLIEGILQYSRVGRIKEKPVMVDLNKSVSEVIDLIAPPENIQITIENSLPNIVFEKTRIEQVFQNLLSNAIKFMNKPNGEIKINSVMENGCWKFSVADNGPGIEEKYFIKIFQIFQTLVPRDIFESTGVGLAVVKKIIEGYGGKIWVESKVGEGSTFSFTISSSLSLEEKEIQESINN